MAQAAPIGEILAAYFRENGMEQQMLGDLLVEKWPEIMGPQVARLTGNIEIKEQVLYVQIRSAALKQQLFECRTALIKKLNESIGAKVIEDIRLR
ncbi:MAG: DUF721 domain-containing protein [Paludibacteraceae bacterium]|nr:DUF721 domain-containing protein [Paludibacteraceae bacterium]